MQIFLVVFMKTSVWRLCKIMGFKGKLSKQGGHGYSTCKGKMNMGSCKSAKGMKTMQYAYCHK